jgi:hypothetical protein
MAAVKRSVISAPKFTDQLKVRTSTRRPLFLAAALLAASLPASLDAQVLAIGPEDIRIEAHDNGGYDLYVRKKPGMDSILLTESTKDPAMKADNFAYRSAEFNEINGREKRMLNGKALPPKSKLYSLISSTPIKDDGLGSAFRILIPPVLVYGYPWSRSGAVAVGKGTFINIRAFAKPYADYAGAFMDNPYQIAISTKPAPPPPPPPAPPPAEPGPVFVSPPQEQPSKEAPPPLPADDRTSSKIGEAIDSEPGKSLDLVVCLDTTQSMEPYIEDIKKNLGPIIRSRVAGFKSFRVGLVLYKDYWPDDYITRKYPFTADIAAFERNLRGISVMGGKDIPEAEVEALYAAATEFDWSADRRLIILVTDAPPHPDPKGKLLFADFAREAAALGIQSDAITEPKTVPPPKPPRGEFENEVKRLLALGAGAVRPRLLAVAEPETKEEASAASSLLDEALLAPLSAEPSLELLRPARSLVGAGGDASALAAALAEGATHALVSRTQVSGAFSETVSRLLEAATGKELARDVVWRAMSGADEAEFVNGERIK